MLLYLYEPKIIVFNETLIQILRPISVMYYTCAMQKKYYHTVKDHSMYPLLHPDDVIEFVPGRPEPDGRVCLVRDGKRHRVYQVFREGEYYRLQPLNPDWAHKTEHVHVEKVQTLVISEESREWVNERWKRIRR